MQLEHRFTVPVPPDVAWEALLDPERVAPCFPGATLESVDGPAFTGTVKVRLGPIALLYKGKGVFTETDAGARRTVIEATGKDSRGNGTAVANVAVQVRPDGDGTAVDLVTDLTITGRPAQLGRGLIADVGGKIVKTFAECLAGRLTDGYAGAATAPSAGGTTRMDQAGDTGQTDPAEQTGQTGATDQADKADQAERADRMGRSSAAPATHDAKSAGATSPPSAVPSEINLIDVAGTPLLKRLAPVLLGALVLFVVLRRVLRR